MTLVFEVWSWEQYKEPILEVKVLICMQDIDVES